jgi:hypothetical protein
MDINEGTKIRHLSQSEKKNSSLGDGEHPTGSVSSLFDQALAPLSANVTCIFGGFSVAQTPAERSL